MGIQCYKIGDVIDRTYEVQSVFTNGGMGLVYKVQHLNWRINMAMKCPRAELFHDSEQKAVFVRECEAWMDLGVHPNIVSCYYVRQINSVPSVLMEFADGGSLQDCIRSGRLYEGNSCVVLDRILDIAIQTARGLGYAHSKGYIHQDVKPANVLLTATGIAKISDFGMAKAKNSTSGGISGGGDRSVVVSMSGCTPAYASPEQAMRGHKLTRRTDIWSWAVMILEMMHGEIFWRIGPTASRDLNKLLPWQIYSKKVCPSKTLVKLVKDCLREHEEERPRDFDEIVGRLLEIYQTSTGKSYIRRLPSQTVISEATLCNRIASYAELALSACSKDSHKYNQAVFDCKHKLQAVNPWSTIGELNYAAYWRAAGTTCKEILSILENHLVSSADMTMKRWLVGLLLSIGKTSVRDKYFIRLGLVSMPREFNKVQQFHSYVKYSLAKIFEKEPIREWNPNKSHGEHGITHEHDFGFDYDFGYTDEDERIFAKAISEHGSAEILTTSYRRNSGESLDEFYNRHHDCRPIRVCIKLEGRQFEIDDELPEDTHFWGATIDDRAIKASLWIMIHGQMYQKVYSVEKDQIIPWQCDYRKIEGWGELNMAYVSGNARLMMTVKHRSVCSLWINDARDQGDGWNACVVDLADYGLIAPELVLPNFHLDHAFEFGLSDQTAYCVMEFFASCFGSRTLPCFVMTPDDTESLIVKTQKGLALQKAALQGIEHENYRDAYKAITQSISLEFMPDEQLLSEYHNGMVRENTCSPRYAWIADSQRLHWVGKISHLYALQENGFSFLNIGWDVKAIQGPSLHEKLLARVPFEHLFGSVCGNIPIAIHMFDNGDVLIGLAKGEKQILHCISRVRIHDKKNPSIVWNYDSEPDVPLWQLDESLGLNEENISFKTSHNEYVILDAKCGCRIDFRAESFSASDFIRFGFKPESRIGSIVHVLLPRNIKREPLQNEIVEVRDKTGSMMQTESDFLHKLCRNSRICGISEDGHKVLINQEFTIKVADITNSTSKIVYSEDPYATGSRLFSLRSCTLSQDGSAVAVLTCGNHLKVIDAESCVEVFDWQLEEGHCQDIAFDRSGRWLAVVRNKTDIDLIQILWAPQHLAAKYPSNS